MFESNNFVNKKTGFLNIKNSLEKKLVKSNTKGIVIKKVENVKIILDQFLTLWDSKRTWDNANTLKDNSGSETDIVNKKNKKALLDENNKYKLLLGNISIDQKAFNNLFKRDTFISVTNSLMNELKQTFLQNRLRRYLSRKRFRLNWSTKNDRKRRVSFLYAKRKKNFMKKRRRRFTRFKKVHWYFPSYYYFDARTLRSMFLYNPQMHEIMLPFKGSLSQVHSFYRSLGL